MKYAVILRQDVESNWLASVPAFLGCHTWGRTRREALANAEEAAEGCIESLRASGDPPPDERKSV
jgi:predicted RNase H-like HicB family nuclease